MGRKRHTGMTLFLQRGQACDRYLCALSRNERLQVVAFGSVDAGSPLPDIVSQLGSQKLKPRQLVLLLPRSEFDVNIYQIPAAEENEIPSLVENLVAESHETMDVTTDFLLNSKDENGSQHALTWTLQNSVMESLRDEAKTSSMQLASITSHTMGSISLWRSLVKTKSPHAVIVTLANRSIDFSVIFNHEITHVRSIPFASSDTGQLTSRLISELQRTVAITGGNEDSESTRIYLFGSAEQRKAIAEALTGEFDVPVSILNPMDHTDFKNDALSATEGESYAHLIGAAGSFFHDCLDVDLLSPREAPRKSWPWRKTAWYSAAAAVLLGLGGFVVWDEAQQQIQEIAEKRKEYDDLAQQARRVIEMKDELAAIRAWRKNEVVWLDEIDELSRNLP
ncbi:MAG: hypothetical protein VX768_12860, partial [Planctomycetota bacterium]|nr:hypothetical protein [Planctomycetota bacterium]